MTIGSVQDLIGRDVRITVNRGYSGWSFLYENCMRLLEIKRSGKEIHILYFGDFDPSGNDMDNALCYISLGDIDLQRVAVIENELSNPIFQWYPRTKRQLPKCMVGCMFLNWTHY